MSFQDEAEEDSPTSQEERSPGRGNVIVLPVRPVKYPARQSRAEQFGETLRVVYSSDEEGDAEKTTSS